MISTIYNRVIKKQLFKHSRYYKTLSRKYKLLMAEMQAYIQYEIDKMVLDMAVERAREELEYARAEYKRRVKTIDNLTYKEIISEEELKTYKGTLEWKDNKKYLILYGTGSYSIATGSREDTDEEIIEAYREALKKTLR